MDILRQIFDHYVCKNHET